MKTIRELFESIAAHIVVEQGTSGVWTYRKYADGTAECWGINDIGTFAPSANSAGIYYRILDVNFPTDLFIEPPAAFVDIYWDTGVSWASSRAVSETKLQYVACKLNSTSYSAVVRYCAKGKWK